jgi:hypothetical protein
MRILLASVAAVVFALTAHAETTTHPKHTRQTLEQHFQNANVTHDGHLTLDQAKTGYKSLVPHFTAVDRDNKGYVTEDDIRAYDKTRRALHHQPASSAPTPSS